MDTAATAAVRSRHRDNRNSLICHGGSNERLSGIGNARRAGIRDQRHTLAFLQGTENAFQAGSAAMGVKAGEGRVNVQMRQEFARVACILRGNHVRLAQDSDRA